MDEQYLHCWVNLFMNFEEEIQPLIQPLFKDYTKTNIDGN